jgi:hypothetical protein
MLNISVLDPNSDSDWILINWVRHVKIVLSLNKGKNKTKYFHPDILQNILGRSDPKQCSIYYSSTTRLERKFRFEQNILILTKIAWGTLRDFRWIFAKNGELLTVAMILFSRKIFHQQHNGDFS